MRSDPTKPTHDPVSGHRGDHRADDAKHKARYSYTFSPLGLFAWNLFVAMLTLFVSGLFHRLLNR